MTAWYRRWPLVSGIALIVITNAVALGGVMYNRSGEPESTLTLTQRELALPYRYEETSENTGLSLSVFWRVEPPEDRDDEPSYGFRYGGEPAWLDGAKLEELGIRVRARAPRNVDGISNSRGLPVDVWLVLEMDGPAYKRLLERTCNRASWNQEARDACTREKNEASRLFVVDAGLDRHALRAKYPETTTHAIVRGQIEATRVTDASTSKVTGHISGVSVDEIQVPVALRAPLGPDPSVRWDARNEKPFVATVAFGRRHEPWIVKLSSPSKR